MVVAVKVQSFNDYPMTLLLTLSRTLTYKKCVALLGAYRRFLWARFLGKDSPAGPQPFVSIEPTNHCNLHCPECVSGSGELTRPVGYMSLDNFKKIIDQIYKHTIVLNLYLQGEPYLHPRLPEMIAYAKEKRLFVSLSTNANILPKLSVDTLPHHLIISADGATQEAYAAYRKGGQLHKVLTFVQSVAERKKKEKSKLPFVELQFLVNKQNKHEEKATRQLFEGYYNRFVKKSMQIIHQENLSQYYAQSACCGRYINDKKHKPGCYKMLSTAVFTQDGQMALCCMDKNAEFSFGNALDEDYVKLINNQEAQALRKMIINQKDQVSICQNCPFA